MRNKSEKHGLHPVPDEELMRRYADGDTVAFEELFRRHEAKAFAFFSKRTHSPQRAQDLYQELFLRLHRSRTSYDPNRPFRPWFFQIATRLVVDDYRRAFRKHETPMGEREMASSDVDSQHRLAHIEEVAQLLGELSPEERHVLVSAKVEGISYVELADDLGKSVSAVKKVASRAMQRLRRSPCPPMVETDSEGATLRGRM